MTRAVAAVVLGASAAFSLAGPGIAAPSTSAHPFARPLAVADSLDRAGDREAALAILDPIVQRARADDDRWLLAESLRLKGRVYFITNRVPESEVLLRESLTLARAQADTSLQIQVLNVLAYVVRVQGNREESRALYREQLAMAAAVGDRRAEASAMQTLADDEREAGRLQAALEQYRKVLAIFEEAEDTRRICSALLRVATCQAQMGELEAGRAAFTRCASLAHGKPGLERLELSALGNIAQMDMDLGDPGPALAAFERNYKIEREIGSLLAAASTARNIAQARLQLDQPTAAAAVLEELLPVVRDANLEDQQIELLVALGGVREHQTRYAEADSIYASILVRAPDDLVDPRLHATRGRSRCLAAQGDPAAALALLESAIELRARGNEKARILFDQDLAELLVREDRWADALAVSRRIDRSADEIELDRFRVGALARAASCHAALGAPDSALTAFAAATALWERERTVPLDAEWRAMRSQDAYQLGTPYAALMLRHAAGQPEASRRREAFDILQRFKARTLMERMVFPGKELGRLDAPPVTLEEVQERVLRSGELLLDMFVGDPVLMAAVTRQECRILELPALESEIHDQVDLYGRLLTDPSGDGESLGSVTAALSGRILSGITDLLEEADRVLFAPGGSASLFPLALLHRPDDPRRQPLIETHEVIRVPSTTVLAWYREGLDDGEAGELHKLLAITGARAEGQPRLPGAASEVKDLASRYRGVEVREPADVAATIAVLEELDRFEVVHVSAHADLDDEQPWRSGIVLGVGDPAEASATSSVLRSGSRPGELMLRASDIVQLDLNAKLAVLSACETGGGRIVSGEGVQGLTTAFLGAGVRSVVATLWPVDDESTARWVSSFYDGLSDGLSAAGAMRRASLELRSRPATRHPFHWAGFVLVGDGDTHVALDSRAPGSRSMLGLGLALAVVAILLWRRRLRARTAA